MPILWRYLLRHYFQVFGLCVSSFIAILLVTRMQDIARFASTGASKFTIFLFVIYQIPFILPIAIPISCLIAALLLFQKLSRTHELTALRASGLGLMPIMFPLLATGVLLSLFNFTISSEIAPRCHALSKNLAYQITATNPLSLLQKDTLVRLKNSYIDMKVLKSGKYAKDVIFIMRNLSNQRLGIMIAKELSLEESKLVGKDVTFISTIDTKKTEGFDHLVIENQAEMATKASDFTQFLRTSDWHFNVDNLSLRMIRAKKSIDPSSPTKTFDRANQEIAKRLSLSLAAFTFTFIGVVYGMEIGRTRNKRRIFIVIALAAFYMLCFMAAKSMKHSIPASILFYLIPHPLILLFSLYSVKKVSRGHE